MLGHHVSLRRFLLASCISYAQLISATALFAADPPEAVAPRLYPDKSNLLVLRGRKGERKIDNAQSWQRRREHILIDMQLVMGPLPASATTPLDLQVTERVDCDGYERRKITFAAEPGDRVSGYLLVPDGAARRPAMLCLHQTVKIGAKEPIGLGNRNNLRYADELARRGYVTLAVDYPNYGDYVCDVYARGYASATMKGIVNHRRAVDLLQSLDEVDGNRIGVIGHSLGGHNSLFVAAFDPRIRCAVTSCGFCSFSKYMKGDLSGWSHAGYMPWIRERYGADPARIPFDFSEVLAAIAPRAVFIVAPLRDANFDVEGVRESVAAARPVFELLGAADKLVAIYPDAEHDFPPESREAAYRSIDRWLGFTPEPAAANPK
jgi:dienelactone hydrolase